MNFKDYIRAVPDFPIPGILFRDITPLLQNPQAFIEVIWRMGDDWSIGVDAIAALDARGFIFGAPLAIRLGLPLVLMRKKGKLPYETVAVSYGLEYGEATLEAHIDSFPKGARVLVVDDLLATGGTAKAACTLIEQLGATVAGCAFAIEIEGLGGRELLKDYNVKTLISYE